MKSFRFSYILAMLLAGGATTALTGCIDTTEPAGITELRGAKALLLKARAAFIDAKTQRENVYMEQDKVKLEQDKINLEISKLNLELQKALNDLKLDSTNAAKQLVLENIQKERDALALKAEKQWWDMQEQITIAEKDYKKAVIDLQVALLTYKDDKIANKIQKYTEQLYGVGWNDLEENPSASGIASGLYGLLNQANLDLVEAQREKVLYTASTEDYLNTLSLQQTEKQNVLKIQQDLLDRMKTLSEKFAQDSLQAVKERLIEIDDAIAKLDEKKRDLYNEAQEVKTTKLAAVSEKVAEYDAVLNKDTTFVLDIVDEKLQDDLYHALSDYTGGIGTSSFESEDGKYVMTSPVEIRTTVRSLPSSYYGVPMIKNAILQKLQSLYYNGFIQYVTFSGSEAADLFEADGVTVKGAYAAQLKNELQRLELDKEDLRQEYKDALDKWLKTYETLDKAVTNYGGYKEVSAKYTAAVKAIDDYKTAISELDDNAEGYEDNYLKLSQDLRDKLVKDYFAYRAPIDSVSPNYLTLKKTYIDKDKDGKEQLTKDNMTAFYNAVTSKYSYYLVLGSSTFVGTEASYNSGKGALQEFLKAEGDLFRDGSRTTYLEYTLQPEKTSDGKYVAPVGINAENYIEAGISYSEIGDNSKFYKAVKTYENNQPQIFTTLPDWVSLYTKVDEQLNQVKDRVDALIAAKKAIVKENQEAYTAMWEKEVECYLIDGENNFTIGSQYVTALSIDNPYYEYYIGATGEDQDTGNPIVKPSVTEKGTLVTEKELLEALVAQSSDGKFTNEISYVVYDETTGTYKPTKGRWEELVAAQQKVVEDVQEKLDNLQQRIDLLNELGYIEYSNGKPVTSGDVTINTTITTNDKYVELLDKNIEQAQKKVDILQAEFDKVQAKIQSLVDAAADENFGSSDATYPGFEVDNSTSTNTPSTDTPSTDTPSGDATNQEQPATEEPA